MPAAAIVLAAGEGRRMGQPKALLTREGEALVCGHVRALVPWCPVLVIVRPSIAAQVRSVLQGSARVLEGEAASQAGSLRLALRELMREHGPDFSVLVAPVDVAPARESTLRALCEVLADDVLAATPVHHGKGGHPVLVRAALLAPLLDAGSDPPPLRVLLAGAAARRVRVEVNDPSITRDFDTPGEAALAGYFG